ncbi:type II toxin-antitoxin system Phd/YefM family antitoxin [Microlunatus sp. GCM10028923]|uniref:type II toxin-antitoxin system Phd/YefM family antitoxin n=1 Tax=Microlunatus sp. GCM10028923 TaxID=3273400 RepID=UPI0036104057
MIIPISEAKAKLPELFAMSDDEEVTLLKRGRPAAVLLSAGRWWEEIRVPIEDLEDVSAIKERADEPRVDLSEFINRSARSD